MYIMSPNTWGPPIWTFFHTLAEKIKEDKFSEVGPSLYMLIRKICTTLPCPDCSRHAGQYFARVNFSLIRNKQDFKVLLFHFHNSVNRRKNKQTMEFPNLTPAYANMNIINTYNQFIQVYHTRGNFKLMTDSFQRQNIIRDVKMWVMTNIGNFSA